MTSIYICHVKICAKIIISGSYDIVSCIDYIRPFVDVMFVSILSRDSSDLQILSQKLLQKQKDPNISIVCSEEGQQTYGDFIELINTGIKGLINTNDPKEQYVWYLFHANNYIPLLSYDIRFPNELRQKLNDRYYKEKQRKIKSMADVSFDLIRDFKHT